MTGGNVDVVLVWTLCTVVASSGCRCGTLHDSEVIPTTADAADPYNPRDAAHSPPPVARIGAIKTEILGKLGLDDDGGLPRPADNVTTEERRRAMALYRQSVQQLRGKSHRLPGELGTAKQFSSFTAIQPPGNSSSHVFMPILTYDAVAFRCVHVDRSHGCSQNFLLGVLCTMLWRLVSSISLMPSACVVRTRFILNNF